MPLSPMDAVNEIRLMWDEWKGIPFPAGYGGRDIDGICLTSLDTFAAGCIDTFICRKGRLDKHRVAVMESCKNDLEVVVPSLKGDAHTYFNNLLLLSKRVLQLVGR